MNAYVDDNRELEAFRSAYPLRSLDMETTQGRRWKRRMEDSETYFTRYSRNWTANRAMLMRYRTHLFIGTAAHRKRSITKPLKNLVYRLRRWKIWRIWNWKPANEQGSGAISILRTPRRAEQEHYQVDKQTVDIICRSLLAIVAALRKQYDMPEYKNVTFLIDGTTLPVYKYGNTIGSEVSPAEKPRL